MVFNFYIKTHLNPTSKKIRALTLFFFLQNIDFFNIETYYNICS